MYRNVKKQCLTKKYTKKNNKKGNEQKWVNKIRRYFGCRSRTVSWTMRAKDPVCSHYTGCRSGHNDQARADIHNMPLYPKSVTDCLDYGWKNLNNGFKY